MTALSTDRLEESKIYVQVVDEKGKATKCPVEVGPRSGDQVEILDGLESGEKVLKEYPKEK